MMKMNKDSAKIAKAISEFLDTYAPDMLTTSDCTLKSYTTAINLYLSFLESKGVTPKSLSRSHFEKSWIEDWIIWLRDVRKCSNDTCNVRLSSIRVFVKYLSGLDIEYLYLLGESRTVRRKKPKSRLVKGLSREAVAAVLAVPNPSSLIGKRDLVFLSLLYSTAARLDEIRSLRIRHLHLDASKPYVILIGKGEKLRTAYLLPKIVRLLQLYIDAIHGNDPDPDAYLFYSRVGGPHVRMSEAALDKRIKICAKEARKTCSDVPLDLHAHQFRHAKATHWLEDGISIVQISRLLGHAQLETTMKYLDITTEDKVAALATLEDEKHTTVHKKWKSESGSLKSYCGL